MFFAAIARTSELVRKSRSRTAKLDALVGCLRELDVDELEAGVAFLSGEPPDGRIGVGAARAHAFVGRPAQLEPALSVRDVDEALKRIAGASGRGASTERDERLGALFAKATPEEQRFLARLLGGELRQGVLEGWMADAVARAMDVPADGVRRAVMLTGSLPSAARIARAEGHAGLRALSVRLFRPLAPMLAQTAEDLEDALARFARPVALEPKLDGARIQLHKDGSTVRVFSREGNDVTGAVPEVAELAAALPVHALVLDGEVLALHPSGAPRPFQGTMRRFGRKRDDPALREALPLTPFFFDCLAEGERVLVDTPYGERVRTLDALVPEGHRVERLVTPTPSSASAFESATLSAGHEGLLVKALDSAYEAGRRGAAWLKVKPAHTLDLVVLAAEWGHGRRTGRLSNLHLGARDPDTSGYVMLGKTFKGLTDAMLAWQTEHLSSLALGREGPIVHVRPELVVEVAFDGVLASPHYPGGLALRFARVKRFRPDKRAEEADVIDTVRALLRRSRTHAEASLRA